MTLTRRWHNRVLAIALVAAGPAAFMAQGVAAAAESATAGGSVIEEKVTLDSIQPTDSWFDLKVDCPADHPFLVLDDLGVNNNISAFRAVTYHTVAAGNLRFGEVLQPAGSWWDNVFYTGAYVHVQARDQRTSPGHQGLSYFCASTNGAAHQAWEPYNVM